MNINLEGKKIFITGSGGVLGTAYIKLMLESGAEVIATDLPGLKSDSLIGEFGSNKNFKYYDLDVSNEGEVVDIFSKLKNDNIQPNVILNNAAITGELLMGKGKEFPNLSQTSIEDWEKTIKVNLTGAFLIARQMDRDIVGKYPCKLINVASMYALNGPHHKIYEGMPFKSFSAYSSSKAGIHGLTLWLAGYWASKKCTVNTISPGAVFNVHSDEFQKRVSNLIIAGRMADPKEIGNAMLFLCSDNSNYMNGQMLNIDGGFSAW